MKFTSVRIITNNIKQLVPFYETVLGFTANWATEDFAEIVAGTFTLAIGSTRTIAMLGENVILPATNQSSILEFMVLNVDTEYERIREFTNDVILVPTTMPWGNRSLIIRDPDGNLINFFTPVTPQAIKKFGL
jgi:catechol 2,3-dioxygenase-like lactoylglutathione lyase family enzyme